VALKPIDELGPLSQAKREQILTAARRLFLERGFERTSMEAIREAAAVSKPTLYNHYENKEALFADVMASFVERIAGEWLPAIEADTLQLHSSEDLRTILTTLARRALAGIMQGEYLALLRMVIAEMPRFPQLSTIFRDIGPQRGLQLVGGILTRAQAHGIAQPGDIELAARMFVGPLFSYAFLDGLLMTGEPHPPSDDRIELIIERYMRTICERE
jgi:TetR/AcrR family transcriptional repressor of mexJK operon